MAKTKQGPPGLSQGRATRLWVQWNLVKSPLRFVKTNLKESSLLWRQQRQGCCKGCAADDRNGTVVGAAENSVDRKHTKKKQRNNINWKTVTWHNRNSSNNSSCIRGEWRRRTEQRVSPTCRRVRSTRRRVGTTRRLVETEKERWSWRWVAGSPVVLEEGCVAAEDWWRRIDRGLKPSFLKPPYIRPVGVLRGRSTTVKKERCSWMFLRVRKDLEQALDRSKFSPKERKPAKRKAENLSINIANGKEGKRSPPPLARARVFSFSGRENRAFLDISKATDLSLIHVIKLPKFSQLKRGGYRAHLFQVA